MLRLAAARSKAGLEQGISLGVRRQWPVQRSAAPFVRGFADNKLPDATVLPGSQSQAVAGVPETPILRTNAVPAVDAPPRVPPTPAEVNAQPPPPSINTGKLPPTGTGTASTGPAAIPPPKPKKRRSFTRRLFTLLILTSLGYAGGVYYSLVNDDFHDIFTDYVPFAEDVVGYFEELEFKKRFPPQELASKIWPQTRGENKVTIAKSSGVNARVAPSESSSESAKAADTKPAPKPAASEVKTTAASTPKPEAKPKPVATLPATPASPLIDHVNIAEGNEPVVQDLVKLVNNIITVLNAAPDASKYTSTVATAKEGLNKIISDVRVLKETTSQDAETKIKEANVEFDGAAKELMRRVESELQQQESRWREEYENERESLSRSYQQKLSAELDAAKKLSAEQNKNALLEQEIALQKKFTDSIKAKIEEERNGRLSKLDQLSASVDELEKLTGQWNEVVDATLQTQHLQVALEAVRAKLLASDHPTPFVNELVALKEVSKDNDVVNAAIASINPLAYQRGVPSPASLIDRFRRVAAEVRKASLLPEDAGLTSHAASAVLSRFMFRKKNDRGLPEGDDVEATLARTEVLLEEGDLDTAAREMNGLQGWAGVLSRDWVAECRRVLEVRQAVEVMSAEARLQSLLVD